MYISSQVLDLLISKLVIEYNGTHNSDPKSSLWGRRAYWRIYMHGHGFAGKITTPVKSINPKPATLQKLFRAELRKRFEAVQMQCCTDHYGQIYQQTADPYSVLPLLKAVEGKYLDIELRQAAQASA